MQQAPKHGDAKTAKRYEDGRAFFVLLRACFAVFVFGSLSHAAELDNLPVSARNALEPVVVDWAQERARLEDWVKLLPDPVSLSRPDWPGGLVEVDVSSLWGTYFIECAKGGNLKAEELARVIGEREWTAEQVAAFWDRLDYETADRARQPDVAGQVLAAIERVPHLKGAFGDQGSMEALFGIAQVELYARRLREARALFQNLLERLQRGEVPSGKLGKGLVAYRMAESYLFEGEYESALEWFGKPGDWGAPSRAGEYDVRGEAWAEAARTCLRLGLPEEAATYYERAMREGGGWGAVVAALDRGEQLAGEGRFEEAIAVLSPLTTGTKGRVGASYGLLFIANCYRRQGDVASARRYAKLAIAEASRITDSAGSLLGEAVVAQARELLASLADSATPSTEQHRDG
jgi:tetratricopeptide (TPR) repeat protein